MEPLTSAILFGAGSWAVNKILEKRAAAKAAGGAAPNAVPNVTGQQAGAQQPLLEPHRYPLPVVERFTERRAPFGGVPVVSFLPRHVRGLRAELARRSVVQVPISLDPPDGPATPHVVLAWRVVPRGPRMLSALVLVDNARQLGATVVASHSLFFLADPNLTAPVVMLVGDQNLTRLAGPGGQFAVLPDHKTTVTVPASVETAPQVVDAPVAVPVAATVAAPVAAPPSPAPAPAPAPPVAEVSGVPGIGRGTPEKTTAASGAPAPPSDPVAESPPPPAKKPRRRRQPLAKAKSAKDADAKSAGAQTSRTEKNGKSRATVHADENGAPVLRVSDLIPGQESGT